MRQRLALAILAFFALPVLSAAQIRVITSGGFATPFEQIRADFEKSTGIKVSTGRGASQGTGANTIGAQLRRGDSADVVIMSKEGLDALIAEGRIVAGSGLDLAQTPLGVAVPAGARRPDVSTVEAFKQTLLHAKAINFPSSTTGIYMTTKLFPQLGMAGELAGKTKDSGANALVSGESELAIQPASELVGVAGVDFVGPIPAEIQYVSVFSAAMVTGSGHPDLSKRLIAFLGSEGAKAIMRKSGMEPSGSR